MHIPGYMPRIIDGRIDEYLKIFGAVCIEGNRLQHFALFAECQTQPIGAPAESLSCRSQR